MGQSNNQYWEVKSSENPITSPAATTSGVRWAATQLQGRLSQSQAPGYIREDTEPTRWGPHPQALTNRAWREAPRELPTRPGVGAPEAPRFRHARRGGPRCARHQPVRGPGLRPLGELQAAGGGKTGETSGAGAPWPRPLAAQQRDRGGPWDPVRDAGGRRDLAGSDEGGEPRPG